MILLTDTYSTRKSTRYMLIMILLTDTYSTRKSTRTTLRKHAYCKRYVRVVWTLCTSCVCVLYICKLFVNFL
jgi:hypothetical protein